MELMAKRLKLSDKLTNKDACRLLYFFIRHGRHNRADLRMLAPIDIRNALMAEGYSVDEVARNISENPSHLIPLFESISVLPEWHTVGSDGDAATISQIVDGVTVSSLDVGAGHVVMRDFYMSPFFSACRARDDAISKTDFESFDAALQNLLISVEAYLNMRAIVYNGKCESGRALEQKTKRGGFVSLETKLTDWVKEITGFSLDTEKSQAWDDLIFLKGLRNDAVHRKSALTIVSAEQLADGLNRFRNVAELLVFLHQVFGDVVPSKVIRAAVYPDVLVEAVPF